MKLEGKTALITGGTSGIGLATAQEFIREGAKVVVTGRTPDTLAQAAEVLGPDATVVSADVTKSAELDDLFKQVREKHGHIDVLFANAGIGKLGSVESTTEEVVDELSLQEWNSQLTAGVLSFEEQMLEWSKIAHCHQSKRIGTSEEVAKEMGAEVEEWRSYLSSPLPLTTSAINAM